MSAEFSGAIEWGQPPAYGDSDLARVLKTEYDEGPLGEARQMFDIADTVAGVGLPQLRPGFIMYGGVTLLVADRRADFDDWPKIRNNIGFFAGYAKNPLLAHCAGQLADVPPLWRDLYYPDGPMSVIEAWRRFWKAHICVDLPLTVADTNTVKKHEADFFKVDDMLHQVAHDLIKEHVTVPQLVGRLGLSLMMGDVRRDRRYAWRDGQEMLATRLATDGADQQSTVEQSLIAAAIKRGRRAVNRTQPAFDRVFALTGGRTSLEWQEAGAA